MPKNLMSYWQKYDLLYKKCSKKSLFEKLKLHCLSLGLPFSKKGKRGPKFKFLVEEYVAFICLQKIFRHRYRDMELEAELYLSAKADHSTFQRNYEKISEDYFEKLVVSFVDRKFFYWIADSTAMSSKISVQRINGGTRRKELLTDKYHIIIGYDPPTHTTQIIGVLASDNHISDSKAAIKILENKHSHAYFLGDSAYFTYELHEKVKEVGLFPLMKPDKKIIRKKLSTKAKAKKLFNKNIYKNLRGVVETVFGGATNAGLILSYARKEHNRRLDTLILAIRHNLMSHMRLLKKIIMRQTRLRRLCPK